MTPTPAPNSQRPEESVMPVPPGLDAAELWRSVCEVTGDFLVVVEADGRILFTNRVVDLPLERVIGQDVASFTVPESAARLRESIAAVAATGERRTLETTVRRPDGGLNYFSLSLGPVRVEGRTAAVLLSCENILPLKTSEQSLRHERQVLRRLLAIQERERQLVSYEIHDGLSQYLAGAMMHLEAYEHLLGDADGGRDLREGLRLLRAAADEARRLIGGLRPPALDELGIVDAIESLVGEARVDVPRVEFRHRLDAGRLPADVETTIFRIVQESLSNVRRHAGADSASVRLEQEAGGGVRVVVEDDGVGFEPSTVPDDRFGLEGIRQRAQLLGGEAMITSLPGRGTTVTVRLPLDR
jgi:PAS domain S-box-containing protein